MSSSNTPTTIPTGPPFSSPPPKAASVDHGELAHAARELDPVSYQQEFAAEFVSANRHRVYYTFDRALHSTPIAFEPIYPLIWAIDFKRQPHVHAPHAAHRRHRVRFRRNRSPERQYRSRLPGLLERAEPLYNRVPGYQRPLSVQVYGDASGHQKRTSAAETDWTIIRHFFLRWKGTFQESFHILSSNPPVRDRINCVNSRLRNTLEENRLFIDPRCRELIKDLEQVAWAVDSTGAVLPELDKSDRARTHASDALGYYIAQVFPLKPLIGHQSSGRIL